MKGIQHVKVSNRYAQYEFDLNRNITIVCGDSGTGKTTLFNMIADFFRNREQSGVNLSSTAPCMALTDSDWAYQLKGIHESIVFIDEDAKYITSIEFASAVKNSDNYYVIFNREGLYNLPYSTEEVYEIKHSGKFHHFKKRYPLNKKHAFRTGSLKKTSLPDVILTEDSHSGYQFFCAVAGDRNIQCRSAGANSAVFAWLKANMDKNIAVVCDGAAFGAEMDRVSKLAARGKIQLILPESFEWLILKSGIIENISAILENPSEYIESSEFFSWEQYFTHLLTASTKGSYLQYSKTELNPIYIHKSEKAAILAELPDLE